MSDQATESSRLLAQDDEAQSSVDGPSYGGSKSSRSGEVNRPTLNSCLTARDLRKGETTDTALT